MAHRRPAGPPNRGDVAAIFLAHATCNQLLAEDPRVADLFRQWVQLQEHHRQTGPPAWVQTDADLAYVLATMREIEITNLLKRLQAFGVPWRWCAEALVLVYFPIMRYNDRHPEDQRMLRASAGIRGLPKGRLPRRRGQDIEAWVRWWYRRTVKDPPDDLHVLVDEYARQHGRTTAAHSVVQNGLASAAVFLNLSLPTPPQ